MNDHKITVYNKDFKRIRFKGMKIIKLLFSLFIYTLQIYGDVQDHLKPALDKEGYRSIPNIDFIYTINLDERPEKYESCLRELQPYAITPYRFSAVNGWQLSVEDINDVGVRYTHHMRQGLMASFYDINGDGNIEHELMQVFGKTYFSHCMSRGAIGICLSHLSVLRDALISGYQTIWVMEDDVEVIRDPHVLSELIDELDAELGSGNWDILFTDRDTKDNKGNYVPCFGQALRPDVPSPSYQMVSVRNPIGKKFREVGARYGAYSMIIRRSGMKKLWNHLARHQLFLPYDIEYMFPEGIKMVTVVDDVVSTKPNSPSDNGSPGHLK
jgi:GR25 family glycosyltransferase involved in LPS biosynthesis